MENSELIHIIGGGQKETPVIVGENIEEVFSALPSEVRKKCLGYFVQLPKGIAEQIESGLVREQGVHEERAVAQLFEKWNKEDRVLDEMYTREDILEFDEVDLEIKLRNNMYGLFSRSVRDRIMECTSFDEFANVMRDFVAGVWSQRGKAEITSPDRSTIENIEKVRGRFYTEMRNLEETRSVLQGKIGKRQHIPKNQQTELAEVENAIAELKAAQSRTDFEYIDRRGTRMQALENEGKYKAAVQFSEFFSREDYAVLLLEICDTAINQASRFNKNAHPELLDYNTQFFEMWARERSEPALIERASVDISERNHQLIERFVTCLQSYLRHRDSQSITESEKEALAGELPVILRMLRKR